MPIQQPEHSMGRGVNPFASLLEGLAALNHRLFNLDHLPEVQEAKRLEAERQEIEREIARRQAEADERKGIKQRTPFRARNPFAFNEEGLDNMQFAPDPYYMEHFTPGMQPGNQGEKFWFDPNDNEGHKNFLRKRGALGF